MRAALPLILLLIAGCGGNSAADTTTPPAGDPPPVATAPSAPTGLAATSGNGWATVTWSATSGATSYAVKRSATSGGSYAQIATPTLPTYTDSTVTNGTTYFYVVAAINAVGSSPNSTQVSATPTTPPVTSWPAGDPGCGFTSAAFCDIFDAPATVLTGRSYELNSSRWSLARLAPDLGKPDEIIGGASMLQCRSDITGTVYPPFDTRVCTGNTAIQSNFLKTATGAQNYGSNAYRIRQPFDFAGRTGKIVFDADATAIGLLGWIAIAVTEDPIPSPSFSNIPGAENFEGGVIPKNGITIEMEGTCDAGQTRVDMIHEFRNYADYDHDFARGATNAPCFNVSRYHLNHFELRLSQTKVELWATPYSDDGVHFGTLTLVASANLGLTFSRGYVQLIGRNHATRKYWPQTSPLAPADTKDAWVVSWDNIGFDGPVINNTKEFEVPDALVTTSTGVDVGYFLTDSSAAQKTTVMIKGVTGSAQATRARLAMDVHYYGNGTNAGPTWGLTYRLNGKTWHTYSLSTEEQAIFNTGVVFKADKAAQANGLSQGVLGHVIDVPVADLVDGDNTLEIATTNVPFAGYPPTLSNVDLVLTTP